MTRRAWLARLLAVVPVAAVRANGSTVRGKLYRVGVRGEAYPAGGVAVRVTHPNYGPSSYAYSDSGGMYALFGIPPGEYVLEVWVTREQALRFKIVVLPREYTDIAPIRVP